MEPSVVLANRLHCGYPARSEGMPCAVGDAAATLADDAAWAAAVSTAANTTGRAPPASGAGQRHPPLAPLIVLDCYDPAAQTMLVAIRFLRGCRQRLSSCGVVAVNAHLPVHDHAAIHAALWPFVAVFGAAHVHVGIVAAYDQALVVCTKGPPGDEGADVEGHALRSVADYVTVARIANHPAVAVRMASTGDAVRRPSPMSSQHATQAAPEVIAGCGIGADGGVALEAPTTAWLDEAAVGPSRYLRLKAPPRVDQNGAEDAVAAGGDGDYARTREWLIPVDRARRAVKDRQ